MQLFYQKTGDGPIILVLHGLYGMSDNWMSIAKTMSLDNTFYLPDLRNHGRSPHSNSINYDLMADDVKQLMDKYSLQQITLLGHSMGGKVAMKFAEFYPTYLKNLVVVDISPSSNPAPHLFKFLDAMLQIDLNEIGSRGEAEEILTNKTGANIQIVQFLLKNLYRDDDNKFKWRLNLVALKQNMKQLIDGVRLEKIISVPALFIKGGKSDHIKKNDEQIIQAHFSNASIVEIPEANHWVHATAPAKFINTLKNFLSKN